MHASRFSCNSETIDSDDTVHSSERLLAQVVENTTPCPQYANGIAMGIFEGYESSGEPIVAVPAWGLSRLQAQTLVPLASVSVGQSVALGFNGGDPLKPIVLGVMLTSEATAAPPDVLLDGERVVLEAATEIELRCGEAALIMSADGRIQLRGTYITSQASATQRILGGSVNVN